MTPLEQLCTSCGRCCDGSVFAGTSLEAHEQQRFGCASLPQRCPHLTAERRCAIYATRPKACSSFLCVTALELKHGRTTLDEARRKLELKGV
jgi:Fe-S-cluster containining protein